MKEWFEKHRGIIIDLLQDRSEYEGEDGRATVALKELRIEPIEPDLENCTIRELEMFKIGFEHGKRVEREKK